MVLLGRRAQRVIAQINATADKLRCELLADIPRSELQTCIGALTRIRKKAEKADKLRRGALSPIYLGDNGQNRRLHPISQRKALRSAGRESK